MSVGVGVDSYISMAAADAYFAARTVSEWAAAGEAARAAGLLRATVYLDGSYRFIGEISDRVQPLAWPRIGAIDSEGRTITGVPLRLAHACAELALIALSEDLSPPERHAGRILEERVGPVSVRYAPGAAEGRAFPFIDLLLVGLIRRESVSPETFRS